MPWLETAPMEQRERFVRDHRLALYTMTELSARYGISRKTGYKWLDRFDQGGRDGLGDRSRAPQRCPHKITDAVATLICEARRQHPSWGPDKLLDWLGRRHPRWSCRPSAQPGISWRARAGQETPPPAPLPASRRRADHDRHPNDLWTADFKGHFRTRDGVYCYPLTVADQHTRYLLACHGLLSTKGLGVRPVFDRLFREYGLPRRDSHRQWRPLRDDRDSRPVAAQCLVAAPRHSASAQPTRVAAGQRGARTDAQDAQGGGDSAAARHARAPAARVQPLPRRVQRRAAAPVPRGATPASRYRASPRPYTGTVPPIEYPGHFIVKRITNAGTFRFKKKLLFIANSLKQHTIGLEEVADGIWSIHFCQVLLGRLDERDCIIRG